MQNNGHSENISKRDYDFNCTFNMIIHCKKRFLQQYLHFFTLNNMNQSFEQFIYSFRIEGSGSDYGTINIAASSDKQFTFIIPGLGNYAFILFLFKVAELFNDIKRVRIHYVNFLCKVSYDGFFMFIFYDNKYLRLQIGV